VVCDYRRCSTDPRSANLRLPSRTQDRIQIASDISSSHQPILMLLRPRRLNIIVLSFCALFASLSCIDARDFQGTELTNQVEATSFSLYDQYGQTVALEDLRGKVVALTFLYTYCPDICSIVADRMRETHALLKDVEDDIAIVAVSVDSERDTQERILEYSLTWHMEDKWSLLGGNADELSDIWESYFINSFIKDRITNTNTSTPALNTAASTSVTAFRDTISSAYLVEHSAPVYLIDPEGKMRIVFTLPFKPASLAHDIRLLLNR